MSKIIEYFNSNSRKAPIKKRWCELVGDLWVIILDVLSAIKLGKWAKMTKKEALDEAYAAVMGENNSQESRD